jgi:hypothetical protein
VTTQRMIGLGAVALSLIAFLSFAYLKLWSESHDEVRSALGEEILVMRTKGGLLEVSTIRATESFDTKFVHTLLLIPIGHITPMIRVPAYYRYHIELAPEWKVLRTNNVFTVVAPSVRPSLPVAVDLARMEKDVSGTWALLPFNGTDELTHLERSITENLAQKAASPIYIQLQRDAARKTVTEFVEKWLVTQTQWKSVSQPRIRVLFEDEPVGTSGIYR